MTRNSASSRTPEEQRNLDHVLGMFRDVLQPLDADQVDRYIAPGYIQHSPMAAPGRDKPQGLPADGARRQVRTRARSCCAPSSTVIT